MSDPNAHYGANPNWPVKPPVVNEATVEETVDQTVEDTLDNRFVDTIDRIAIALESIGYTLKQISKKLR